MNKYVILIPLEMFVCESSLLCSAQFAALMCLVMFSNCAYVVKVVIFPRFLFCLFAYVCFCCLRRSELSSQHHCTFLCEHCLLVLRDHSSPAGSACVMRPISHPPKQPQRQSSDFPHPPVFRVSSALFPLRTHCQGHL